MSVFGVGHGPSLPPPLYSSYMRAFTAARAASPYGAPATLRDPHGLALTVASDALAAAAAAVALRAPLPLAVVELRVVASCVQADQAVYVEIDDGADAKPRIVVRMSDELYPLWRVPLALPVRVPRRCAARRRDAFPSCVCFAVRSAQQRRGGAVFLSLLGARRRRERGDRVGVDRLCRVRIGSATL